MDKHFDVTRNLIRASGVAVRFFLLCVTILATTSLTFANVSVLCLGSDGHIDIELGSSAGCFHTNQTFQVEKSSRYPDIEKFGSFDKGCGSCTDISFSSEPIIQNITNTDNVDIVSIILPASNWLGFTDDWSIVKRDLPSVQNTAPPSAHLELLRSVIILS